MWEFYKRRRLDAGQRLAVEIMLATDRRGMWAAKTTGREMSRQNGKGDEIEVVEFWGLTQRAERILHTVHDAVLLSTQTQARMLGLFEHPDLRRLISRKWLGTGQQMIELRSGATIWYRTRTGGGGRGVDDVDRVVVDEAQHADGEHLSAITPTLLAAANQQLNALGSAGIAGKSEWWWQQRIRALGKSPGAFGYLGHSAEKVYLDSSGAVVQEPVDPEDREAWRRANPALVAGRVGMDFFEEQFARLGPDLFAREHLGVWDPLPSASRATVIPMDLWRARVDKSSAIVGRCVFGVDVSTDGARASIAVVGYNADGLPHVEVVDSKPGTSWLEARLIGLRDRWEPAAIAYDAGGPAAIKLGELVDAAAELGAEVKKLSGREYAAACEAFKVAVVEDQIRHLGDTWLTGALHGAAKRIRGDGWLWDRASVTVDITPLVAATVALRALVTLPAEVSDEPFFMFS